MQYCDSLKSEVTLSECNIFINHACILFTGCLRPSDFNQSVCVDGSGVGSDESSARDSGTNVIIVITY